MSTNNVLAFFNRVVVNKVDLGKDENICWNSKILLIFWRNYSNFLYSSNNNNKNLFCLWLQVERGEGDVHGSGEKAHEDTKRDYCLQWPVIQSKPTSYDAKILKGLSILWWVGSKCWFHERPYGPIVSDLLQYMTWHQVEVAQGERTPSCHPNSQTTSYIIIHLPSYL